MTKDSGALGDGLTRELEEILFACLERPPTEREAAFAAACALHPTRADALRRCWQRIKLMQSRADAAGPTQQEDSAS